MPERALFSGIRYLALTCEPDVLAARLRARPAWREWDGPRIAEMLEYARWVGDTAHEMDPPVELLDTTRVPVADTADDVARWAVRAAADGGAPVPGDGGTATGSADGPAPG